MKYILNYMRYQWRHLRPFKHTAAEEEHRRKRATVMTLAIKEVCLYIGGCATILLTWYGIGRYIKYSMDPKEFPKNRPLLSRCTIETQPLEECDYPSLSRLYNLGKKYGYNISQASWAATHFCPLEFHIHIVEDLLRQLTPCLQTILLNHNSVESSDSPPIISPDGPITTLAELVIAILDTFITDLANIFPSANMLKHIDFETNVQAICSLIQNVPQLQELTLEKKTELLKEGIWDVISEFLVANWEASRYFDSTTYKEGYFGPRETRFCEGRDVGTRGASYIGLDKPKQLRVDIYPQFKTIVKEQREAAKNYELNVDRTHLNTPSFETRARQLDAQKVGVYPGNLLSEYKAAKKKKGNDFHTSASDHFKYDPSIKHLPNEEDPYKEFLSSDEFGSRGLSMPNIKSAVQMLHLFGVVKIKNVFPKEAIMHLRRRLFVSSESGRDTCDKLIAIDRNIIIARSSLGRITAFLRGSSFEPFLVEMQRVWMPLIYGYFPTEQYYGGKPVTQLLKAKKIHDWGKELERELDDDDNTDVEFHPNLDEIPTERLVCSAIHLTCQEKNAPEEGFAVDNAVPSFTVLVALDDMKANTLRSSALEIIPGTHHIGVLEKGRRVRRFWRRKWDNFFWVFFRSNGPVTIDMKAGDVVVWDSRVFRRLHGNGNLSTSNYILFRYDFPDTFPPCQTISQAVSNKIKSRILFWGGLINRIAFSS